MKRIVGAAIGVEIDYYAVIGFEGVRQLVNAVGGVDVVLAKSVSDPYYWVTSKKRGVYFPAGRNHLNGDRALIFARTRKGDNDFERARRQQLLVAGAVDAVRERGLDEPAQAPRRRRSLRQDRPAAEVARRSSSTSCRGAKLGDAEKVVFGPTKWATGGSRHLVQPEAERRPGVDGPVDGAGRRSDAGAADDAVPRRIAPKPAVGAAAGSAIAGPTG